MFSHDKIINYQEEMSKKYRNKNPSEVYDFPWIYCKRKLGFYHQNSFRSGKWLVFCPNNEIDSAWKRIKLATKLGLLGNQSKTSTMYNNPNAQSKSEKVICVYTYDYEDEKDVMRVREVLRNLGFTQKLSYKSDHDTMMGRYSHKGHKNISKYYC